MTDTRLHDTATREADARRPLPEGSEPFRVLLIITTHDRSLVHEFGLQRVLTIGRSEPADVRVADPGLSRLHASFSREGETVRVKDLGSRNGTWVAGQRVEEAVLRAGDAAVLGGLTVTVQIAPSAGAAMLGVLSSDGILRRLEEEWARAQAFRRALSVVLVRPLRKGEAAPADYAPHCTAKLRAIDRVGLYDRDSLLVVLPETNADAAARTARELIAAVKGRAQLACGIASYPDSASTPDQLVSAAFQAAREAKEAQPAVLAPSSLHVREPHADDAVRRSPAMLELQRVVERIAPRTISVLVLGETGTGKELVARELHVRSPRAKAPLRVVNCAAIPEHLVESVLFGHVKGAFTGADRDRAGVFEQASGGTVFLDEVGELSADAQAALLRVLDTRRVCPVGGSQEIEVDVRVVAATHRDLAAMSEQGSFRLDLYYRLNGVVLELPPLRERLEEIEPLVEHFLGQLATQWGGSPLRMSPEAMQRLLAYPWPGNVRELRNAVERAAALAEGDVIGVAELPAHIREPRTVAQATSGAPGEGNGSAMLGLDLRARMQHHEVMLIKEALRQSEGNQRKAAELLHLPLRTFERKLKQLNLRAQDAGD